MFTGIIEKIGILEELKPAGEGARIRVRTGYSDLSLGESIAVNGACLTVAAFQGAPTEGTVWLDLSSETLSKTRLGSLSPGQSVSLERALLPVTRLSGHWVQGHVDGLAKLQAIRDAGMGCHELDIDLPPKLERYVVEKGSIALDGISLTVNRIEGSHLSLTIVPHTWEHTHLRSLRAGDSMHVEVDVLAKYAEKLLSHRAGPA